MAARTMNLPANGNSGAGIATGLPLKSLQFVVSVSLWFLTKSGYGTKSSIGSFLPVTLEQLAREVGVLRSDRTSSCVQPNPEKLLKRDDNQCVVHVLGYELNTSSFAL